MVRRRHQRGARAPRAVRSADSSIRERYDASYTSLRRMTSAPRHASDADLLLLMPRERTSAP